MDVVKSFESKSIFAFAMEQVPKLVPLMLLLYIPILLGLAALLVVYLVADAM
jgi:hypothetical protein